MGKHAMTLAGVAAGIVLGTLIFRLVPQTLFSNLGWPGPSILRSAPTGVQWQKSPLFSMKFV